MSAGEELPLAGIKVLELAQMVAGPSAGLLLADYGADVVKVEPPQGDGGRLLRSLAAARLPDSPVFVGYNRDKRLIRLDLRSPEGRERVLRLIDEADVVIEAARPGVMERLGLGADELLDRNPRLVYASVSGFGRGPIGRTKGGVDIVVQAESGIISTTGYPDRPGTKIGFTAVDAACGHALCHGVLAALFRRERTGRGDVVRLSLYDVALHLQTGPLTEFLMTGVQSPRAGNSAPLTAPADLLRCADGAIIVSAYLDSHWRAFTAAIGAPELLDDPRFTDGVDRARHRGELVELIEKRLAGGSVAEWVARLLEVGVLVAEVKDYAAVVADPLAAESGLLREVGEERGVASPVRLERTVERPLRPRRELDAVEFRG
ncbi:CaiB/BaiF CoA-transferase family protein [Pseudonocardia sp. KRD291]|uniref:CaiB/BaiF CoA transferase family protein n=1 Tax=Pseudonocardia sp. KRD291 TaxID=2792007 RepID=UPI001C49DFAD|nr:CoA transferase [Pseudonocardia sp. KRD291]MBW0100992.1 CoA transferase [Pseudonocardia sp. KRD291]